MPETSSNQEQSRVRINASQNSKGYWQPDITVQIVDEDNLIENACNDAVLLHVETIKAWQEKMQEAGFPLVPNPEPTEAP